MRGEGAHASSQGARVIHHRPLPVHTSTSNGERSAQDCREQGKIARARTGALSQGDGVPPPLDLGRRTGQCPRRLLSPRDGGLPLTIDTSPLPALVVVDREMWKKIALNLVSSAFNSRAEAASRSPCPARLAEAMPQQ